MPAGRRMHRPISRVRTHRASRCTGRSQSRFRGRKSGRRINALPPHPMIRSRLKKHGELSNAWRAWRRPGDGADAGHRIQWIQRQAAQRLPWKWSQGPWWRHSARRDRMPYGAAWRQTEERGGRRSAAEPPSATAGAHLQMANGKGVSCGRAPRDGRAANHFEGSRGGDRTCRASPATPRELC